jgi:hypothetical protein
MSTARAFMFALAVTSVRAYDHVAVAQRQAQSATPLVTIISADSRLRTSNIGLRIAVRDADAPDRPVDQAYIVLSGADVGAANRRPLSFSADDRGLVTAATVDSHLLQLTRMVGLCAALPRALILFLAPERGR